MGKRPIIIALSSFVLLWILDSLTLWENLATVIFIFFLFDFLEKLGKKIVMLDLTNIMAAFTCLLMPVIFYHEYPTENHLAHLWGRYMPVSSDTYFSFMVPSVIALAIGLKIPLRKAKVNTNPKSYMDKVQEILKTKPNVGIILIAVGVCSGLLDFLLPASLRQFFYFLDHLTFVGVFYVIYSPGKHKKYVVPIVVVLMISQALATGMFGDLVFISICALVLILLGKNIPFRKKFLVALAGTLIILIIQSVKADYREEVWLKTGEADPAYYAQLVSEKIIDPTTIVEPNRLFFIAVRMNQGWLVGMTMHQVPEKHDFAYGETIWQSIAAAIVPRFLWRDKPEAGGKNNLKRFWGYNIQGYSMNIGPFGEAYANFDTGWGVLYLFLYGLFFNFMLTSILKIAEKRPTIILWLPFLFFYSVGVETDLLSTMGFLLKGLFFTWMVFTVFRVGFRIDL